MPSTRVAHRRECLGEYRVQRFTILDADFELGGLGLEFGVSELLHPRLKRVDLLLGLFVALEQAFITAAEQAGQDLIEHGLNA